MSSNTEELETKEVKQTPTAETKDKPLETGKKEEK